MSSDVFVIIGYSGHAFVVCEAAELCGKSVSLYVDKEEAVFNPFELNYMGNEHDVSFKWNTEYQYLLGIGSNNLRYRIYEQFIRNGCHFGTIIHPQAMVSAQSHIDDASFVARGAMINPLVHIGKAVIVNTGSSIDHECTIGDGAHIAPNAVLAGGVVIGRNSFVGANSVIKEGLKIGENVTIGAGTVVLRNIPDGARVVGNPGRSL